MSIIDKRLNAKKLLEQTQQDENIKKDCEILPANYNFEIAKTIWKIRTTGSKKVALQFPEGLLLYSCVICDILRRHTDADIIIMGDVTYGACCIDDFTAKELGCDMLVHYGHSCLVPIQETPGISMLYIFVDIRLNTQHFVDTIRHNFESGSTLAFVSTIQFVKAIHAAARALEHVDTSSESAGAKTYKIIIPQSKPLSPGEILGCTSPRLPDGVDALVYLGDGRFHLESAMIHNPHVPAYQYDPYSKVFTKEEYGHNEMLATRRHNIELASNAKTFGLILGTLGHQGNTIIFNRLEKLIRDNGRECITVLLSEIFPQKLARFQNVDCWVQVACPRLSIDWGGAFEKPLITPFELNAALKKVRLGDVYPMDYYANDSLGPWTNNNKENRTQRERPPPKTAVPFERKLKLSMLMM